MRFQTLNKTSTSFTQDYEGSSINYSIITPEATHTLESVNYSIYHWLCYYSFELLN